MFTKLIFFALFATSAILAQDYKPIAKYEGYIALAEKAYEKYLKGEMTIAEAARDCDKSVTELIGSPNESAGKINTTTKIDFYKGLVAYIPRRNPEVVPANVENLPVIKTKYEVILSKTKKSFEKIIADGMEKVSGLALFGRRTAKKILKALVAPVWISLVVISGGVLFAYSLALYAIMYLVGDPDVGFGKFV